MTPAPASTASGATSAQSPVTSSSLSRPPRDLGPQVRPPGENLSLLSGATTSRTRASPIMLIKTPTGTTPPQRQNLRLAMGKSNFVRKIIKLLSLSNLNHIPYQCNCFGVETSQECLKLGPVLKWSGALSAVPFHIPVYRSLHSLNHPARLMDKN